MFNLKFAKFITLATKQVAAHNISDFSERVFLKINNMNKIVRVRIIGISEKSFGTRFKINNEIRYEIPIIANGRFIIFSPPFM